MMVSEKWWFMEIGAGTKTRVVGLARGKIF